MKKQTSIQLRALRHLQFIKLRVKDDVFAVPNEAWANFFVKRNLAERVESQRKKPKDEQSLQPSKASYSTGGKSRGGAGLETDRPLDVTRADVTNTQTG